MKRTNENKWLFDRYSDMTKIQLSDCISQLDGELGENQTRSRLSPSKFIQTLIFEKKAQLEKIRSMYAGVKVGDRLDLAGAQLARIQGMEAVALSDLESMEGSVRGSRTLKISIDIAKTVMKQKLKPEGRQS